MVSVSADLDGGAGSGLAGQERTEGRRVREVFRGARVIPGASGPSGAALDFVREGDTFFVTKPDRLARSTADLLAMVASWKRRPWPRGAQHGRTEVDTRTATGKLMLTMLGAIAALERDLILNVSARASPKRRRRKVSGARPSAPSSGPGVASCGRRNARHENCSRDQDRAQASIASSRNSVAVLRTGSKHLCAVDGCWGAEQWTHLVGKGINRMTSPQARRPLLLAAAVGAQAYHLLGLARKLVDDGRAVGVRPSAASSTTCVSWRAPRSVLPTSSVEVAWRAPCSGAPSRAFRRAH